MFNTALSSLSLFLVLARDCDTGLNAELSYFIQSVDFDISSQGVVNPSQRLDYERPNHMYECTVVAVDKGTPPRTGTASIRIRMANVNDEAPVFSQTMYDSFLLSAFIFLLIAKLSGILDSDWS